MKLITAALVALGFTVAADADEAAIVALINKDVKALKDERDSAKSENTKHIEARKTRVTARVDLAITDKLVKAERKEALIAEGVADEAAFEAHLADIEAMAAEHRPNNQPRGFRPAPKVEGDENDVTAKLEDIQAELRDPKTTPERSSVLAQESTKLKGLGGLFKKPEPAAK